MFNVSSSRALATPNGEPRIDGSPTDYMKRHCLLLTVAVACLLGRQSGWAFGFAFSAASFAENIAGHIQVIRATAAGASPGAVLGAIAGAPYVGSDAA